MSEDLLLALLEEKKEREAFEKSIIDIVYNLYETIDKKKAVARKSATAQNVYKNVCEKLGLSSRGSYRTIIKNILVKNGIIRVVAANGYLWFLGLLPHQEDKDIVANIYNNANKRYEKKKCSQSLKE